jgi:hypothetical protein
MAFSLILGLWVKPRVRSGTAIIGFAVVLMIIAFWLFPSLF